MRRIRTSVIHIDVLSIGFERIPPLGDCLEGISLYLFVALLLEDGETPSKSTTRHRNLTGVSLSSRSESTSPTPAANCAGVLLSRST